MDGTPSPADWHGGLNVSYDIGPGIVANKMYVDVTASSELVLHHCIGIFVISHILRASHMVPIYAFHFK